MPPDAEPKLTPAQDRAARAPSTIKPAELSKASAPSAEGAAAPSPNPAPENQNQSSKNRLTFR